MTNGTKWSKEEFTARPDLVTLFDRLARIGWAMQRARAAAAKQNEAERWPVKEGPGVEKS